MIHLVLWAIHGDLHTVFSIVCRTYHHHQVCTIKV